MTVVVLIGLLAFGLPVYSMTLCDFFYGSSISPRNCSPDIPSLVELGATLWGLVYVSSFVLFAPFVAYIAIVVYLMKTILKTK